MSRVSRGLRSLVAGCLLALPLISAAAEPVPTFYVVEVANFACSHCRDMEANVPSIAAAAQQAGGKYVFGPIVWDDQAPARDLVYYAARLQGPQVEQAVRASIFRAVQDSGLVLEDAGQVMAWLQQDVGSGVAIDFARLAQDTADETTTLSEVKAAKLATSAGVASTPSFVFLKNGQTVTTLSANPGTDSPVAFANRVKDEIRAISK